MYLILILLPLLGSAAAGLRGRALGAYGSQIVTIGCIAVCSVLTLICFYEVALCRSPVTLVLGEWLSLGFFQVSWAVSFDDLTVAILLPVVLVSFCVHIYAASYMASDPHTPRFFSWLSFFTGSMLVLVTADSYLAMFIGWELIGVASYLLIGFWLTRIQAQTSAIKAMCVNRVGDTLLSIGFMAALAALGSLDYATVLSVGPMLNETTLTLATLLFFGGAMSKSAQIPLQTWLADAMEGPTPVSALIHAATLVTAGIYLMLRSSPLLENAPTTLVVMAWIGAATAFYGSVSGLLVNDLKRVIAFSTCSQLGYMVIAVGLSQYHVGLFHLVTHATFKACLFMAAGSVLHSMADEQDMRRLGGLVALLPMTYTAILIASMSLLALPGLTGFYSKDHILELAAGCYSVNGFVVYVTGTLAASVTAFYSTRLLTLVFGSTPRANQKTYIGVHDAPVLLAAPILMLALLAIGFGFMAKDLWLGMGTDFLSSVLPVNPTNVALVEAEFALSPILKIIPLMATLTGIFGAFYIYQTNMRFAVDLKSTRVGRILYWFINGQWHWNSLVTNGVILPSLALGHVASKILDRGAIETVGPFGLSQTLTSAGRSVAAYDTSIVTSYALYMVLGFLGLAVVLVAPVYSNNVALLMLFVASLTLTQQTQT